VHRVEPWRFWWSSISTLSLSAACGPAPTGEVELELGRVELHRRIAWRSERVVEGRARAAQICPEQQRDRPRQWLLLIQAERHRVALSGANGLRPGIGDMCAKVNAREP
jgi:hypothetical protein